MEFDSWKTQLRSASTQQHVLGLMRKYLESRDPHEMEELRLECEVPRLLTVEALIECSQRLSSHHGHGDRARAVRNLAAVFEAASIRLLELRSHVAGASETGL